MTLIKLFFLEKAYYSGLPYEGKKGETKAAWFPLETLPLLGERERWKGRVGLNPKKPWGSSQKRDTRTLRSSDVESRRKRSEMP